MKPGIDCLLAVLRDTAIADYGTQDFEDAFALAGNLNVVPLFISKMRVSGNALPFLMEQRLAAAEREIALQTFWWMSEMAGILAEFASAGVHVILLKGPCLAERIYGGASLRLCRDIDLLVGLADTHTAREVLAQLGFTFGVSVGIHESWARDGTLVELHSNVASPNDFKVDIEAMCARAVPVVFAGQPAYVLAPDDELLSLCLHGAKHCYDALSHVLDVAFALRHFGADRIPNGPKQRKDLDLVLSLGGAMAQLFEGGGARESDRETKPSKRVKHISRLLWSGLTGQSKLPRHWRSTRRLYLALQPTPFAQMRHLWTAAHFINASDRAFARKLYLGGERHIHLARYLRLLIKLFAG